MKVKVETQSSSQNRTVVTVSVIRPHHRSEVASFESVDAIEAHRNACRCAIRIGSSLRCRVAA